MPYNDVVKVYRGNQYTKCLPHDGEKQTKTFILQAAGITHPERREAIASLPDEVFEKNIAEIKLRAERRIGEFSRELPKNERARTDITSPHDGERSTNL